MRSRRTRSRFLTEPFADAAKLRASFGGYESAFNEAKRSEPSTMGLNAGTPTMLLFGPSDHVIYPDFDRMASKGVRQPRRPVPAARLRPLRAVGGR